MVDRKMQMEVVRNEEASRYELHDRNVSVGIAEYRLDGARILFTHTRIDPSRRGQGLGEQLVAEAVRDAKARGLEPVGICSFVADLLKHHPNLGSGESPS